MSDKPKSALTAMISRVIAQSDALHEDLHELDDELSHHVSHLLKKIAKLTAYAELEIPDKRSPEAQSLITRNLAEIQDDLRDLHDDAVSDAAIYAVGEAISKLVGLLNAEWTLHTKDSKPATKESGDPVEAFEVFEQSLQKLVATARADIAVRHAYLALREMAKFWRANDDRLATLAHEHEHEHAHEEHQHYEEEHAHPHAHDDV